MAMRLQGKWWQPQGEAGHGAAKGRVMPHPQPPLTAPQECAPQPAGSVGSRRSWPAPASVSHGCLLGQAGPQLVPNMRPGPVPHADLASILCRQ